MNYLAHLFLAGKNENLIIGNFIADHVKGKGIDRFSPEIRRGIKMHRAIDEFTDKHPQVQLSILRLRPVYRKYSGVIVDMFYDHYLAKEWSQYSDISLSSFTEACYAVLMKNFDNLPARSQRILPHMMRHNWLLSYSRIEGLQQALTGMSNRTTFISKMENAVDDLNKCYECYQEEFRQFFPELQAYALKEFVNGNQE